MRSAKVYYKDEAAGVLTQHDDGSFSFRYDDLWFFSDDKKAISINFTKEKQNYESPFLFPFFINMLPEGSNKHLVCKHHKIDKDDYFSLLLITAYTDTIGAVTIKKI